MPITEVMNIPIEPEVSLASTTDLLALLSQFAIPGVRRQYNLGKPPAKPAPQPAVPSRIAPLPVSLAAPPKAAMSPARRRAFCQCGSCKTCTDNQRWERIFQEKFADPAYYGALQLRHNSALAGAL